MKNIHKILACLLLMVYCLSSLAQQALYQTITIRNGLPSDYVTSLHIDRLGILWIGTDKGLCRYDGSTMQVLNTDNGLRGVLINHIFEDTNGDLYVSSPHAGLSRIEYKRGQFLVSTTLMDDLNVYACFKDKQGYYWISASGGENSINLYRTKDLKIEPDLVASFANCVKCFGLDSTGTIWYNAASVAKQFDKNINLEALQPTVNAYTGFATSIFVHSNNLGMASHSEAIIRNVADVSSKPLKLLLPDNTWLGATYSKTSKYHTISKGGSGMLIYERSTLVEWIGNLKYDEPLFIKCMIEDAYGNLYISNFGKGIIVWKSTYLRQYDIGQSLRRIAIAGKTTYFNTENHGYVSTNGLQKLKQLDNKNNLFIHFCSTDSMGTLYLTGYGSTINAASGKLLHGFERDLSDIMYHQGYYYQSSYSNGLLRSKNAAIDTTWDLNSKLPTTIIERVNIQQGKLYAYTLNKGLIEVNLQNNRIKIYDKSNGLLSNSVYEAVRIQDTLMVGTDHGLNVIVQGKITSFTSANGLEGLKVVAVFKDAAHRLWVLSDKYLHQYINGALYAIRSHPVLLTDKNYITTAKYQEATNKLWIGINTGVLVVAMDKIHPNHLSYPAAINNIEVGSQLIPPDRYRSFSLSHGHEALQINLAQPHYSTYTRPVLLARLNGYDTTWIKIAPNGKIIFNRLPEGKYSLELQSIGPDLGRVEPYVIAAFTVQPPWWKQGWFFAIVVIVLATIAFIVSRVMLKREYMRKLEKAQAETALQLERSRISRELHDNVGSMLTVIINRIDDEQETGKSGNSVSDTASIARSTLSQLRDTIWAIDSPKLSVAQWNTRSLSFLQSLHKPFHYRFQWPESLMLSPTEALNSFRILQEACNNAVRHGKTTNLNIETRIHQNKLELIIADNGIGFDIDSGKKGMGLRNMQRRTAELNGSLNISSSASGGTTIELCWQARQQSTF